MKHLFRRLFPVLLSLTLVFSACAPAFALPAAGLTGGAADGADGGSGFTFSFCREIMTRLAMLCELLKRLFGARPAAGTEEAELIRDVTVDKAYLKKYDASKIRENEIAEWDNQEVYDQMVAALQAKQVPIVAEPSDQPFRFGNLTLTMVNTVDPASNKKVGENDQSLCLLVEKNGTRVFLAADLDNYSGDEKRLAPQIGKVDLLKVGHHSYSGSSSAPFIRTLSPKTCVITNWFASMDRGTLARIERICQPAFYNTGKEAGVLAVLGDGGKIDYYGQIQS